jgi:hypothetical protein
MSRRRLMRAASVRIDVAASIASLEGEAHLYTLTWAFADLACPGAGAVVPRESQPVTGRSGTELARPSPGAGT